MDANVESKVCPLCAETIKAAAKVCPHCRHWQKKFSLRNPLVAVTLFLTLYIAVVFFVVNRVFGPRENFAKYRDEIRVVSSQFSHRVSGSNVYVTVVGIITNCSGIGWKNFGVEAEFFDKKQRHCNERVSQRKLFL